MRAALDDLTPVVNEFKPATKDLAPFLRELRPLIEDSRPVIHDLRIAVTQPGANNDLIDATRKMPRLQRVASPAFRNGRQAQGRAENAATRWSRDDTGRTSEGSGMGSRWSPARVPVFIGERP